MAAKAWSSQQKAVEEVFFQNDAVSLCLLINRRAKTMRVVDFRAGPTLAKRKLVLELAKREGMEKAYTLVERDELASSGAPWTPPSRGTRVKSRCIVRFGSRSAAGSPTRCRRHQPRSKKKSRRKKWTTEPTSSPK